MSKEEDPGAQTGPQSDNAGPQHLQVQEHMPRVVTIHNEKINERILGHQDCHSWLSPIEKLILWTLAVEVIFVRLAVARENICALIRCAVFLT